MMPIISMLMSPYVGNLLSLDGTNYFVHEKIANRRLFFGGEFIAKFCDTGAEALIFVVKRRL